MTQKNYKGEKFFDTSTKLLADLDAICQTLKNNLKTKGQSYFVTDILNTKSFNSLWQTVPNKHDNKYSANEFKGVYAFAVVDKLKLNFSISVFHRQQEEDFRHIQNVRQDKKHLGRI